HQALNVDVALLKVSQTAEAAPSYQLLQASNRPLLEQLYQELPDNFDLAAARRDGVLLNSAEQSYFLHFIALEEQQGEAFLLLMLEDVTGFVAENKRYQLRVLVVAALCFLLLLLLIMLMTNRISRRILQLAKALPLLA